MKPGLFTTLFKTNFMHTIKQVITSNCQRTQTINVHSRVIYVLIIHHDNISRKTMHLCKLYLRTVHDNVHVIQQSNMMYGTQILYKKPSPESQCHHSSNACCDTVQIQKYMYADSSTAGKNSSQCLRNDTANTATISRTLLTAVQVN